jgi:hypothetical protein
MTQPLARIGYAEKEVDRYKVDVRDWKTKHSDLAERCWPWEDLAAKANFLFGRILDLDTDVQEEILAGRMEYDAEFDNKLRGLLREWLEVSEDVLPHLVRLEAEYEVIDGAAQLRDNIEQARAILTPDDQLFRAERLVELRDAAIDAHRRGMTESLLDDEPAQ